MGEPKQSKVTISKRIWQSAWFRAFAVAIIAGLITQFVVPQVKDIFSKPAVEITSPIDGEAVEWTPAGHLVTGTCRKVGGDLHLYVTIHPLPTDKWYVQRMPTIIDGNWQAVAFFGEEEVGTGDQYELCAVISSKTLRAGQVIALEDFPEYIAKAVATVSRVATHSHK